jgi:hypothetical protein
MHDRCWKAASIRNITLSTVIASALAGETDNMIDDWKDAGLAEVCQWWAGRNTHRSLAGIIA